MQHAFPQTDLAAIVLLPVELRTLAVLAALRFASADDLRAAGVGSDVVATLVDRGVAFAFSLQRRMTDAETTTVLALTRRGARELAREAALEPETVPSSTQKSCSRSAMFMDHSVALSGFALRLALALSDADAPARLLSWEQRPERLAAVAPVAATDSSPAGQPIVPDGLAVIEGPRGPETMLVEIDRGTERPGYLGGKGAGYLRFWLDRGPERCFGTKALRILTVAPDANRTERLMDSFREETRGAGAGLFWFTSEDALAASGYLAPVCSTLRRDVLSLW